MNNSNLILDLHPNHLRYNLEPVNLLQNAAKHQDSLDMFKNPWTDLSTLSNLEILEERLKDQEESVLKFIENPHTLKEIGKQMKTPYGLSALKELANDSKIQLVKEWRGYLYNKIADCHHSMKIDDKRTWPLLKSSIKFQLIAYNEGKENGIPRRDCLIIAWLVVYDRLGSICQVSDKAAKSIDRYDYTIMQRMITVERLHNLVEEILDELKAGDYSIPTADGRDLLRTIRMEPESSYLRAPRLSIEYVKKVIGDEKDFDKALQLVMASHPTMYKKKVYKFLKNHKDDLKLIKN